MAKKNILQKIFLLLFAAAAIFYVNIFAYRNVYAETDQERLDRLAKEIDQYENEIKRLNSQASTLSNQIAQYDTQIKLASLKIASTEEKILLLGGRIDQLSNSLVSLNEAYKNRVVTSYKMSRIREPYLVLSTTGLGDLINSYHYLQKIQGADKSLLEKLETAQTTYQTEKSVQQELQSDLKKQKTAINGQKFAKASLLEQTHNDEKRYQQLLSQAKKQLEALKRFVISQGGASILQNQTKCDAWGCYYNQRDSLWGNIGLGGSLYSTAEYGCLVNSVAMIASHYGKNIKPIDIAINPSAFVPGTGYLLHSFSVNGISITINSASKDKLDSELAAGRPVIAGLYSGPDHFIVILRKEGGNYIMHDPFMENGSARPLTDKYSISNINSLRFVQFN
jgi:Uncharacterized protein conserved in bacteria